jgi:hypothetical protein
MMSGDHSPPPEPRSATAAQDEVVRADLAAIDERVFRGSAGASLDDQLATLRAVALNVLGITGG